MDAQLNTTIDPRQYLRMVWRRKGVILLCAITVFCTALIGLEFVPEKYESQATLMIEDRQRLTRELENVMGGMGQTGGGRRADEKRMDELVGRIKSRPFLERVARLLRMPEDPQIQEIAREALEERPGVSIDEMATRMVVSRLRSKISFAQAGTGIYRVIVEDSDPEHAQLLAEWISEIFMDVSAQSALEELKTAHEFGAEQLKIYEEQLRRSERALEQYRQSMIEQDLAKSVVNGGNVALAEALYNRVLDETELVRLRVLPFSRNLTETPLDSERSTMLNEPRIQNQARGLATALKEEITNRLLGAGRQVGDWPPQGSYVTLRRGLFQLIERTVEERYADALPESRDVLGRFVFTTLDHEAHADASEFLGQAISDFKREAQSEPRGEMELARLESQVSTNRELLRSFQAQLVASDVSQAVEMTNLGLRIEVLEPPQVPLTPSSPNRSKILLAAFAMGPLLGVGIAFITELMDPTLRTLSDFRRAFGGPVLGTTPLISPRLQPKPGRLRRLWLPAALTGVILITILFFVTRDSLLENITAVEKSIQVVDPEVSTTP